MIGFSKIDCFRGVRWPDGSTLVFDRKGRRWPPDASTYTWGDNSASSEQLAFDILRSRMSMYRRAVALCPAFLQKVVAQIRGDTWEITVAELDSAIVEIEAEATV